MDLLVGLLNRVVDKEDGHVTTDTLEGVTYLLQRMQVRARARHAPIAAPHARLAGGGGERGTGGPAGAQHPCAARPAAPALMHLPSCICLCVAQVCLSMGQKDALNLDTHLKTAAELLVSQLHAAAASGNDLPQTQVRAHE